MFSLVERNEFGFFQLKEKPTAELLNDFYSKQYYQENMGSYSESYSTEEVSYFKNKLEQKYCVLENLLDKNVQQTPQFIDIGCGEGWAVKYFKDKNWDVTGLDFSAHGCKSKNPDCLEHLIIGDIYSNIELLSENQFDCILLDNVLEHVLDPGALLQSCKRIIKKNGVLIIDVPNDFSVLQQYLFNHDYISKPFWVSVPAHISYFNQDGLKALCEFVGWSCEKMMGDFPIDFNLLNKHTNYINNKNVGKDCHKTRLVIENLLHNVSAVKTNELYTILGELGLGRDIIGFFKSK